jgi:hypothetical protein
MDTETKPAPTASPAVNPATAAHSPRQASPVMDVVPPPTPTPVVEAPAQPSPDSLAVSDDITGQMVETPVSHPAPALDVSTPVAPPPIDDDTPAPPDAGDSPHELIKQAELPAEQPQQMAHVETPHQANPVRTAIIATVILTFALAALAVFAYTTTSK